MHDIAPNKTARFKIDIYWSSAAPFGLFRRKPGFWGWEDWKLVEAFDSIDKCKEGYERIKDLPEYLA